MSKNLKIIYISLVTVFMTVVSYANAVAQTNDNINIKVIYGQHESFDRFVFEYDKKPLYFIDSTEFQMVKLKLPKNTVIKEDKSIEKYPDKDLLYTKEDENNIYYIIESQENRIFEHENKIVVDVIPYKDRKPARKCKYEELNQKLTQERKANETKEDVVTEKKNTKADNFSSINFEWEKEVGLAAFKKDGNIWLVFDDFREFDTDLLVKNTKHLKNAIQIPNPNLTIILLKMNEPGDNIETSKDGNNWVVSFNESGLKKQESMNENLMFDTGNNAYLYIQTKSVKNVITMLDPLDGGLIMIAPVTEANHGYNKSYKYVDLKMLQTFQGLAIEIYPDDILVSKENDGIVIKALNRGLNISLNLDKLKEKSNN